MHDHLARKVFAGRDMHLNAPRKNASAPLVHGNNVGDWTTRDSVKAHECLRLPRLSLDGNCSRDRRSCGTLAVM
jgi:hypothetical protein